MKKTKQIEVRGRFVTLLKEGTFEYINLSQLHAPTSSQDPVLQWLRQRETVIFLGLWESLYNPDFNHFGYRRLKQQTGLKHFRLTPGKWAAKTGGIGLIKKSGKYAGIYAHWDLALEFADALSPMLKLVLNKIRQELKEAHADPQKWEWDMNRKLAKTNNRLLNSVIRNHLSPVPPGTEPDEEAITYRNEANLINLALFNMTAEEWREHNPELARKGLNLRDLASINELVVLANLETVNAVLIQRGVSRAERLMELTSLSEKQLRTLNHQHALKSLKQISQFNRISPAA